MKNKQTKKQFLLALIFCQLIFVQNIFAQEEASDKLEVTGVVVDEFDMPMPYVNVYVKNTQSGTLTDLDGKYAIQVKPGQILVFSYVGYSNLEKTVSNSTELSVSLEPDTSELSEVVVTALGIKKEKKLLVMQ
ncbi:carboxypeptidase-like regulatory domain-containing protein [Zobellia russellii]|uniref:carboxypeptidase-like regulatory domain-containing protein n=1 Tax=Zobellia russellii TaxID=248907 RepID=UPI0037DD8CE4